MDARRSDNQSTCPVESSSETGSAWKTLNSACMIRTSSSASIATSCRFDIRGRISSTASRSFSFRRCVRFEQAKNDFSGTIADFCIHQTVPTFSSTRTGMEVERLDPQKALFCLLSSKPLFQEPFVHSFGQLPEFLVGIGIERSRLIVILPAGKKRYWDSLLPALGSGPIAYVVPPRHSPKSSTTIGCFRLIRKTSSPCRRNCRQTGSTGLCARRPTGAPLER